VAAFSGGINFDIWSSGKCSIYNIVENVGNKVEKPCNFGLRAIKFEDFNVYGLYRYR